MRGRRKSMLEILRKRSNLCFKKILIMILVVIVSVFMTYTVYENVVINDRFYIDMEVNVINEFGAGINTDTDKMYFGSMPPGAIGERRINVSNMDNADFIVKIIPHGTIGSWITVSENNFHIGPGEIKEIVVKAKIPSGFEAGIHAGKLEIVFENTFGWSDNV